MPTGNFLQRFYDAVAHLLVKGHEIARFGEACARRSRVGAAVLTREKPAGKWAPDQDTDVVILGERLELVFETSTDEAVVHLGRYVLLQAQAILQHNRSGCLPRHEVGQPDVADLPLAHKIVEGPKGFLDRRVAVPSMHLVKVDVIGLEPAETALHFAQDIHAGCATPVEILAHREADFGGEDNLFPHALQSITNKSLALP